MGLCSHPVGCLAWGVPTLNSTGCWVGPGLGEKWRPRRMTHADEYSLELLPPLSLPLHWATLSLYLYKRLPRTSRSVWHRFFMRSQLFSLGPGYHKTVVPFKRGVSVAPSPVEFLQVPQTFKARFSRASSPYCQNTPTQAGEPNAGLKVFTPEGEFLLCSCFPVCGSPTWHI